VSRHQVEDTIPSGASLHGSSVGSFVNSPPPSPIGGNAELRIPNGTGLHFYQFTGATRTLRVDKDDILTCWVFLNVSTPPAQVQLAWRDTTGNFGHRAFWGADLLGFGTLGTASRRFMGDLPPLGQWTRLEIPASLVDLEGRVLDGMSFDLFDGACDFNQAGKYPGRLQYAEALITIPPLRISGELTRTIQPEAVVRLQTNYDVGPGVTWSKISGDSPITADGVFTADDAPGTTVVRATFGDQIADLTVSVAAVITPNFPAAGPGEEIQFATNITSPTWTASAGTINSSTGEWQAPAATDPETPVRIAVSNGAFTASLDVLVLEKFPLDNYAEFTVDYNSNSLISKAEDRSRVARTKDPNVGPYKTGEICYRKCSQAQLTAVLAFFDRHLFAKPFILEDKREGIRLVVHFDSNIRYSGKRRDFEISFRIEEAAL
jgi:hypothetical protein